MLSPKQLEILRWPYTGKRALICDGAVRSGKTSIMSLSFLLWAMGAFDGRSFGLCGKTVGSAERNIIQPLLGVGYLQKNFGLDYCRSNHVLTVTRGCKSNRFYVFGGRDESSYMLIQGVTLAGVLLDEAALMPRSFVEQAVARCSVAGSRLWFNCNPEGPQHWFYQEWILKAGARRALRLHFTMEDNPALSERIRERYRRNYSGAFYRRFVLGEWTAAEGLVYDFFDPERDAADAPGDGFSAWRISADYGTVNPASFGLWGLREGVWYRTGEFYYDSRKMGRQRTDAEYAEDLERLAGGREIQRVIVDPSAASFIETLRRRGCWVVKADNDVSDGIRVTADLLRQGRVAICRGCGDCLREISQYCWEQRGERDVPRKKDDHAMDDLRYFAMDLAGDREEDGFSALAVERENVF